MATIDEIEWFDEPDGAGEEDLKRVEEKLGVTFPPDFWDSARRFSGASPSSPTDFDFADGNGVFTGSVGTFLSMRAESDMSLLGEAEALAVRIDKGLIPFAVGPGGDYLLFDYRSSETAPSVIYWHHGREGMSDQYSFVADTFTDFISLLYEPDIEAEEALD